MFWKKNKENDYSDTLETTPHNIPPNIEFQDLGILDNTLMDGLPEPSSFGIRREKLGRIAYWLNLTRLDIRNRIRTNQNYSINSDYFLKLFKGHLDQAYLENRKETFLKWERECSTLLGKGQLLTSEITGELIENRVPESEARLIEMTVSALLAYDQVLFNVVKGKRDREKFETEFLAGEQKRLDDLAGLIVEASKIGDLTSRSDLKNFPKDIRGLVSSINILLDSILVPLRSGIDVIQMVAKRDLTHRIEGDFVGDHRLIPEALNPALDYLNEALTQINDATERVKSNANQMSDAAQSLSAGATQQASSLEQVKDTVINIAEQANENAKSAMNAHSLVNEATKHADLGNELMNRMNEAMNQLHTAANKISQIIKVIEELAFQTNMLSLNAAVEAARAGVHGKGFAVVAEEVGNLAKKSSKASKETEQLIQDTIKCVKNGVEISGETDTELRNIQKVINDVSNIIGQISDASRQQNQEIEEVSEAIRQIEYVTRDNANNAEKGAALAYNLRKEAENLKYAIASFKIQGSGNSKQYKQEQPRKMISSSVPLELPELDESFDGF